MKPVPTLCCALLVAWSSAAWPARLSTGDWEETPSLGDSHEIAEDQYDWVLSQDEADGDQDSPEQLDGSVDDTTDDPYDALYPTPQPPPGPAGGGGGGGGVAVPEPAAAWLVGAVWLFLRRRRAVRA